MSDSPSFTNFSHPAVLPGDLVFTVGANGIHYAAIAGSPHGLRRS